MLKILIVEEEYELRRFMSHTLLRESYEVYSAENVVEVGKILNRIKIDLIILDSMLSGIDGFAFIKKLRILGINMSVIMLLEKNNRKDLKAGIQMGVDYYLVKPVKKKELLICVEMIMRQIKSAQEGRLIFGDTELLLDTCIVNDNTGSHILSQQEFSLLYKLLSYPGRIFSCQRLLYEIWKIDNYKNIHVLKICINQLNEKFQENKDFEIITIEDFGYRAVKKYGA